MVPPLGGPLLARCTGPSLVVAPPPPPQAQYRVFSMMGGMGLISVPNSCSMRYLQAARQELCCVSLVSQRREAGGGGRRGGSKVIPTWVTLPT